MHLRSLAVLLLGSLAVGQATPNASSKAGTAPAQAAEQSKTVKPDSGASVPATAAVITINGVCDSPTSGAKTKAAAKPTTCKTVITRAQFEELSNALQPNMNPAMKRRLADVYPKMLVMAHEAKRRGLESDPKYKQVLQFARLQILSQELSKTLKEEADKVPDSDIQKYYAENTAAFQQADLKRIFVPKIKQNESSDEEAEDSEKPAAQSASATAQKPAEPQKSGEQKKVDQEAQKKADEEAMKKLADSLRTRAVAGEDFEKLQKEAFDAAGVKGTPPSTSIGKLTPNEVPVNHRAVLDLKPGAVSDIITEPNGYYIYKVVAKATKPLEQAKDQIRATLAQQRMQDAVQKIQDEAKTELNETYFAAAPAAPGMQGPGGMTGHGGMHAPSPGGPRSAAPAAPAAAPAKPAAEGQTSAPPTPKN